MKKYKIGNIFIAPSGNKFEIVFIVYEDYYKCKMKRNGKIIYFNGDELSLCKFDNYQQRLAKVLSKFESNTSGDNDNEEKFYIYYLSQNGMSIQYETWNDDPQEYCDDINKPFTLTGDMGRNNNDYIYISLGTVENLLNELEKK